MATVEDPNAQSIPMATPVDESHLPEANEAEHEAGHEAGDETLEPVDPDKRFLLFRG